MQVACDHCGKELRLPPEKVPDGAFTLKCPACGEKFHVDPSAEPAAAPGQAFAKPDDASTGSFEPLRRLLPKEQELLDRLVPVAFLVEEPGGVGEQVAEALKLLGMREIVRFGTVAEAVEALGETEASLLLIEMSKAPPPPCPPLEPLRQLGPQVRRRTFVALAAKNVRSLDGQVAFYLEVSCTLSLQDLPSLPQNLRRALLHQLRLYRHWDATEA